MKREDNHTREEYDSVRNALLKTLFKKYLPLKFSIYDLKCF